MERRRKAQFWKNERIAKATHHRQPQIPLESEGTSLTVNYRNSIKSRFTPYQQYDIFESIESKSSQFFPDQETVAVTLPSANQNQSVIFHEPPHQPNNRISPDLHKLINNIEKVKSNNNFMVKLYDMPHLFSNQNFIPKMRSSSSLNKTRKHQILKEMEEKRNCYSTLEPQMTNKCFPPNKIKSRRRSRKLHSATNQPAPDEKKTEFQFYNASLSKFMRTCSVSPKFRDPRPQSQTSLHTKSKTRAISFK